MVHRKIGLSPGTHTLKLGILKDLQNRRRRAIATTKKAKKKRLALKAKRMQANTTNEIREGTSYHPAIDTLDISADSIKEIPEPQPSPTMETSPLPKKCSAVYFDLESTGLARTSHLTQIAAVFGEESFDTYVIPRIQISPTASTVTGLTCINRTLFYKGHPVNSVSISVAIQHFITYLKKQTPPVFLVGHNIKIFDCPLLLNALETVGKTDEFLECVSGFLDTKLLFKIGMPGLSSYSQPNLFKLITKSNYEAHDAVQDVISLQKLVRESKLEISDESYANATFSVDSAKESHGYAKRVRVNLPSLKGLVGRKISSGAMARKAAGSGLNYSCLKLAYTRNGVDAVMPPSRKRKSYSPYARAASGGLHDTSEQPGNSMPDLEVQEPEAPQGLDL
ncbi:uncharacterized protein LOC117340610 [Pecten maximus]|uniref:uncharacterized protein LOC117340610 n=1 Tax=Pecten maximus TaxID=6579 RepID=UPI0014584787|nr:uncharacterized protein LOC117340610 [Pecten maximus]